MCPGIVHGQFRPDLPSLLLHATGLSSILNFLSPSTEKTILEEVYSPTSSAAPVVSAAPAVGLVTAAVALVDAPTKQIDVAFEAADAAV